MIKKPKLDLDEWKEAFSDHLIQVVFKCLQEEEKERGVEFSKEVAMNFLTRFVGGIVYSALEARPAHVKAASKDHFNHTATQYTGIKRDVENSVASAFQGAMSTFSKMPVDYYCQIKIVPEAVNTKPC